MSHPTNHNSMFHTTNLNAKKGAEEQRNNIQE